jgi:hypothetical protein
MVGGPGFEPGASRSRTLRKGRHVRWLSSSRVGAPCWLSVVTPSAQTLRVESSFQSAASRAIGALWITLYGAWSSSVILGAWPVPLVIAAWTLVIFTLGLSGVAQLVRIGRLTVRPGPRQPVNRALVRKVGTVLGAYAVVALVAASALHLLRHDGLVLPVLVAIVGVHFWVLGRVLRIWQYYVTGVLDLVTVAITLLVTTDTIVGALPAWILYPLLGNGVALFITAGLMVAESIVVVARHSRTSAPGC